MKKERVPREIRLERMENDWYYRRSGMDEKPDKMIKKPTVLFDDGKMQRGWTNDRFGVEEK